MAIEIGEMMRKITLYALSLILIFCAFDTASAQRIFREKKFYGPIPGRSLTVNAGFIDGPDIKNLAEGLDFWAATGGRNGEDIFEEIPTSPYFQVGYERRIAPRYFLTAKTSFSYLSTESSGYYFWQLPDSISLFDIERDLKIYLLSFEAGMKYMISQPRVQNVCPYIGGGFSAVVPMVRLETETYNYGRKVENPDPEAEKSGNSLEWGLHVEFGLNYYITNRFSAGVEGRYQMAQSNFPIHDGNFTLKYRGFSLAATFAHHF